MSQYIPGVVDYIPQIQPFQPDLNFYQQVLQTKNAQYEEGYNKISSYYGNLLESPMLRTENLDLRNQFFNDIAKDITKISGMDLSMPQNVEAASKIFQPLVDNKYILKDMAYTKKAYGELDRAERLKNCTDEKKCGGKYWEGGVRALQYQMQEFSNSSAEDSLKMNAPSYTPYINVQEKAIAWAKEMGFNVTYAPVKSGGYLITAKNGPQMIPDLTQAYLSVFGNDPAVGKLYETKAFLQRKDFISSNLEQFGGDEAAAEKYYIDNMSRAVYAKSAQEQQKALNALDLANLRTTILEQRIKHEGVDPESEDGQKMAETYNQSLSDRLIAAAAADYYSVTKDTADPETLLSTENLIQRGRIDSAVASQLLTGDLSQAAQSYAMLTMDIDYEADPYELANHKHSLAMQLEQYRQDRSDFRESMKIKIEDDIQAEAEELANMFSKLTSEPIKFGTTPADTKLFDNAYKDAKSAEQTEIASTINALSNVGDALDSIINAPQSANGKPVIVMISDTQSIAVTPEMRKYAKAKKDELFNIKSNNKETPTPEEEPGLIRRMLTNPLTVGIFDYFDDSPEKGARQSEVNNTGLLNRDGKITRDIAGNKSFTDPNSDQYYRKVYNNVMTFLSNDSTLPIGKFLNQSVAFVNNVGNVNNNRKVTDATFKMLNNYSKDVHSALTSSGTADYSSAIFPSIAKKILDNEFIKPNGGLMSESEFIKRYSQETSGKYIGTIAGPTQASPEVTADNAAKVYRDYTDSFKELFGQTPSATVQVPGYPNAKTAEQLTRSNIDTAFPRSEGAMEFVDMYSDIKNVMTSGQIYGAYFGDNANLAGDDLSAKLEEPDNRALQVLNAISADFVKNITNKTADKNRIIFDMSIQPVVANQSEYVGVTFTVDQDFIDTHIGTEKKSKIGDFFSKEEPNKISFLLPKAELSSNNKAIANITKTGNEIIMDAEKRISINQYNDYAGSTTISKKDDGSFAINRTFKFLDDNFELQEVVAPTDYAQAGASIDSLIEEADKFHQQVFMQNVLFLQALEANNKNKSKEPQTLVK